LELKGKIVPGFIDRGKGESDMEERYPQHLLFQMEGHPHCGERDRSIIVLEPNKRDRKGKEAAKKKGRFRVNKTEGSQKVNDPEALSKRRDPMKKKPGWKGDSTKNRRRGETLNGSVNGSNRNWKITSRNFKQKLISERCF